MLSNFFIRARTYIPRPRCALLPVSGGDCSQALSGYILHAAYACINLGDAYAPDNIAARSICIDGDIGKVLEGLT